MSIQNERYPAYTDQYLRLRSIALEASFREMTKSEWKDAIYAAAKREHVEPHLLWLAALTLMDDGIFTPACSRWEQMRHLR